MDQQAVTLRGANPVFEEGLIFAKYLDEAAEGFFRFMLGPRSAEIIAKVFEGTDHDFSHQHVTFAERDGTIVGMVSGYTAEQHRRSSPQALEQAWGRWNIRMPIVTLLFAPLLRILDSMADNDFYILAIAVDQELRGAGVGSMLLDAIEEHGRTRGANRLALDVSAKNEGARRLYERRGFIVESTWPKKLRIPVLKLHRMVKPLSRVKSPTWICGVRGKGSHENQIDDSHSTNI